MARAAHVYAPAAVEMALEKRGAIALAAVLIGWVALALAWAPAPLALPFDDAWYYQTIARHLAAGDGFTHDGMQPTNGFHPLWQLVLVPIVALGGGLGPDGMMRLTLVLQTIALGAGLFVLARHRPRFASVTVVAAVALTNPYAFKSIVAGMESALQVLLLAIVIARTPAWLEARRWALTGALLGLLALSRLEALAFVVAFVAFVPSRVLGVRIALVAAAVVAVWVAFAWLTFGAILPVSGLQLSGPPRLGLPLAVGMVVFVPCAVIAWRNQHAPALAALAFLIGAQLAYATIFQSRLTPRLWYLGPTLLGVMLAVAGARWHRWAKIALASAWLVGAALAWAHRLEPASYSSYAAARRDGEWLAEHLRPGESAAGWDIGIVAAHAGGRVANLEGLVAAPDFDTSDPEAFLRAHPEIRYLAQFIRQPHLCGEPPLTYSGVELEHRPLLRHEAVEFRSADPRMSTTIHRMIFDLEGRAGDVARLRDRVCSTDSRR